jgi:uncharacterized protein
LPPGSRLGPSETSWMGVNSRTLSSKRAQLSGRGVQRLSLNRVTTAGGVADAAMRADRDEDQEESH